MIPVSPAFLAALSSPQQVTVRADVDKGGVRLFSGLPVTGGSVTVDRTSIARRRLTMTVAPRMSTGTYGDIPALPRTPTDPLANYGQEVTVQWGLSFVGGGTEWVPLGIFRIDEIRGSLLDDTEVQITGVSREAWVADARFLAPRTVSGPSAQAIIATLIHEVLPSVEVVASASMDRRVPVTTFDRERWDAVTTLATSIGAVCFADAWGRFVIADATTTTTAPSWTAKAGPGGVLVSAASSASRSRVYNGWVVEGQAPSSDSPPVRAQALDSRPGSPTLWGSPETGAYGMVPRFESIPTITTVDQAQAAALAGLGRTIGAAATLSLTTVPNVALDAGDVIDIIIDPERPAETVRRHILDSLGIPLSAGGDFPLASRDIGDVSDLVAA